MGKKGFGLVIPNDLITALSNTNMCDPDVNMQYRKLLFKAIYEPYICTQLLLKNAKKLKGWLLLQEYNWSL